MHSITQLKDKEGNPTGLIVVKVQDKAYDFKMPAPNYLEWWKITGGMYCYRDIDFNAEIIGLITSDTIEFDSKLLAVELSKRVEVANNITTELLYEQRLRELLALNNLYWVNKFGERPDPINYLLDMDDAETEQLTLGLNQNEEVLYESALNDWNKEQSNLLGDNNLLILKKL